MGAIIGSVGLVLLIVGVISVFSPQPSVGINTRSRAVAVVLVAIAMFSLGVKLTPETDTAQQESNAGLSGKKPQEEKRRQHENLKYQTSRVQPRTLVAEPPLYDRPVRDR